MQISRDSLIFNIVYSAIQFLTSYDMVNYNTSIEVIQSDLKATPKSNW